MVAKKFARHPWSRWFAGGSFVLERGVHFAGPTYSMAIQVRNRAVKERTRVSVRPDEDAGTITVHVVGDA